MEQAIARVAEADGKADAKSGLSIVDVMNQPGDAKAKPANAAVEQAGQTPRADVPTDQAPPKSEQPPTPQTDAPQAPPTDTPPPVTDQPPAPPDPLPNVTDAPWLYVDFDKTYVGDNLKLSFQKHGNNIIATGTIEYGDKEHSYPFQVATDNYGTSRGNIRMKWDTSDGSKLDCPFSIEINYVDKNLINVNRPESIWLSHSQDDANCPSNSQFQAWKLTNLSEYHEPPPPPPPPPKPPKPEKPKPEHPKKHK